VYRAHDCVAERSAFCTVKLDVDPDTGGDTVGAAAGPEVSLLERSAEPVALVR
jgi:hypothetical protein